VIVLRIFGSYLPGFGSITIAILLLGGIQLIALGVIGEYVDASTTRSSTVRCTSCAKSAIGPAALDSVLDGARAGLHARPPETRVPETRVPENVS